MKNQTQSDIAINVNGLLFKGMLINITNDGGGIDEPYTVESKVLAVYNDGTILATDRGELTRAKQVDGQWIMCD